MSNGRVFLTLLCRSDCHFRQFSFDTNEQMANEFFIRDFFSFPAFRLSSAVNAKRFEDIYRGLNILQRKEKQMKSRR